MTRFAVALLIFALPVAAHAAPEASATEHEHQAPANAEKPKKICRMETRTGSVMPKRVCRTAEQVQADEEAARQTRERMDRNL